MANFEHFHANIIPSTRYSRVDPEYASLCIRMAYSQKDDDHNSIDRILVKLEDMAIALRDGNTLPPYEIIKVAKIKPPYFGVID